MGGTFNLPRRDIPLGCLPAWPRKWDADFKLHAPLRTTVHAVWRGGKMISLRVSPQVRAFS